MIQNIQNRGYYPYLTDPDEVEEIFHLQKNQINFSSNKLY